MRINAAYELARDHMNHWGLEDWTLQIDFGLRRAGICRQSIKQIQLSVHLCQLNGEEQVVETTLHEIAHAKTPGHGHDNVWKAMCVVVGCKPQRCYDPTEVNMPQGRWMAICGDCNREIFKHQRPRRALCCRRCKCRLDFVDTKERADAANRS